MARFIAYLRAINVGGHVVKMDHLRRLFESLSFSKVETFIASGNVVFESRSKNPKLLERKIESALREALGYEVATFIRSERELADIANYKPFPRTELDGAAGLYIGFLAESPDEGSKRKLLALRTDVDDLHVHEREVYWLCRTKQGESKFSNAVLERALGARATFRSANTVRRMAAKYSSGEL